MIFHGTFEGNLSAQHMRIIFFFKTMKANGINRKCIPKKMIQVLGASEYM